MKQNVLEKWIAVGMSLFVAIGLLFLANIMSDGEQVETVSAYEYYPTETQVVGTHLEIKLSSLEVPEGIYRSGDIVEVPFSVSFSERYDYGHWYAGMIKEEGYDLVSGYKQKRYDPISKTLPTKLFNATARKISGIRNLHDFNCGLKAYRKAVVKNIEVYGEMHRYIPYLAKNAGFNKIGEKVVHHQARKYGSSKFMGMNRFVNGYLDLLTLWFLSTFGKKPMHVFGFLGTVTFFIGFIAAFWIGADKLYCLANHIPQRLVTNSPFFYIALTMMMIGTQLFLTGFLGDLISRSSSSRNDYQIEETI